METTTRQSRFAGFDYDGAKARFLSELEEAKFTADINPNSKEPDADNGGDPESFAAYLNSTAFERLAK